MNDLSFEKHAIGQSVARTEDPRLLSGRGCYADDLSLAGQAYAYVLRSPFAHGRVSELDVSAAREMSGVVAIVTGADLEREGIGRLRCNAGFDNQDGTPMLKPIRPSLVGDRVRYQGEAVAVVVAESLGEARDAAEAILFDVEPLDAVTDPKLAIADAAPVLHDDVPANTALDWAFGDAASVDAIFADAHHVTRLTLRNNRVVVSPMEPRACIGEYDPESGRYTLHTPSQGVFGLRNGMAGVMGVDQELMRIRTYDVGGSFGMKGAPYPEYAPILLAARELRRPVKWCDDRTGSFVSDQHGRDSWAEASLAFDAEGHILAGQVINYANLGAYLTAVGPNMQTGNIRKNFPSLYRIPALHVRTIAAFTNTTPIGAYRGAGRPEGVYYMERLLDTAAREMGIDRVELRRRNVIQSEQMPFDAVSGLTYDSGNFPAVIEAAVDASDWAGFEQRREAAAARGRLRGLGIGAYLEVTGPPGKEMAGIHFQEDGGVTLISGTLNYGQGHAVTFAQIVSDRLGIPIDAVRLVQGDSDRLIAGGGTGGSKSVIAGGQAIVEASDIVIDKGRRAAAEYLEAAPGDIEYAGGALRVVGTDRQVGMIELAAYVRTRSATHGAATDDFPESLDTELAIDTPPSAFPNGCHVAEVEIDPVTGSVEVVAYTVADDFGTLINPMLVEGQVHGGIVQGLGQALLENAVYDEQGQFVAGSYMDYALPRADEVPNFKFISMPDPAKTNALGAKGCGEAGTTGSLPALMNAIVDALQPVGAIEHVDMPASANRLWQIINRS